MSTWSPAEFPGPLRAAAPAYSFSFAWFWPAAVFVLMATSSFVQQEPAPYDLLLLLAMGGFVVSGPRIPRQLAWPALCIVLLLTGYAVGTFFAEHREDALLYLRTSAYLSVSLLFFAALIWRAPERVVPAVMMGLLIASAVAASLGVAGYFHLFPGAEAFALYGRATGPFKDPNVFAPSLILPMLYAVHLLASARARHAVWALPLFLLLALALFLSFSRGGWISALIATSLFVVYSYGAAPRGLRTRLIGLVLLAGIVAAAAIAWALTVEEVRSLFAERAVIAQVYDTEQGGRFASMRGAVLMALENPLGIGPYEWAHIAGLMPHNIYANVFVSGGLISLLGFLGLTAGTLWVGFRGAKLESPFRSVLILGLSVFIAHAIQGLLIDSNHWRHLYVVMALVWGLALAAERTAHD